MKKSVLAAIGLVGVTMIWGLSFVSQSVGMDSISALSFTSLRFILAGVALLPIWIYRYKKGLTVPSSLKTKKARKYAILGGVAFGGTVGIATLFQQNSILYVSVGKAGFLTALYVIMVPILGLFVKKKSPYIVYVCCLSAVVGMYFLCMGTGKFVFESGDIMGLLGALLFAVNILAADIALKYCDWSTISVVGFFFIGFTLLIPSLIIDKPTIANIRGALIPIMYSGLFSSAIATSAQIACQKHLSATPASLIMSLESVFALFFGWAILGQKLSSVELIGCLIVFLSVILSQLPIGKVKR